MAERKTILLVEDEALIAMNHKIALEDYGYNVLTVDSGEKAVEAVRNDSGLDLILMDIDLGKGMDGTETAVIILSEKEIPIVFLSSHSEPEIVEKTEKITSYGYVLKNSSITVLDASIKMAFKLFSANLELKNNEKKFRSIIDSLPLAIHLTSEVEEKTHYVNPAMVEMFGYTMKDIPTVAQWWPLVYPDEKYRQELSDEWYRRVAKAIESQSPIEPMEVVCVCKDGSRKNVSWGYITMGGMNYSLGLDITDRRQAEAAFLEKNNELERLNERLTDTNQRYEELNEELSASNEEFEAANEEIMRAQEALMESETALRKQNSILTALLDNLSIGVFMVEAPGGSPLIANKTAMELLGRGILADASKDSLAEVYQARKMGHTGFYPEGEMPIIRAIQGESSYIDDMEVIRPDGSEILLEVFGTPVISHRGTVWAGLVSFRDITERKQAELNMQSQLTEKEILLKEVHHRIKNSITTIGSLINLQIGSTENPEIREALQDTAARVDSMRVLYEKLLIDDDYHDDVSVKNYVETLIPSITGFFCDSREITIDMKVGDFFLNAKTLFPLGIIINELLTNIMKYAFSERDGGHIIINLDRTGDQVSLAIHDNGIGLPESYDFSRSSGFGHMLVRMLAKQLGGSFTINNNSGAECNLKFTV